MDKYIKPAIDMKISMEERHSDIRYYDIGETPFGLSWIEWVKKWWNWCYQVPNEVPIEDMTGQHCAKNQNEDKIWFLAGTYGGTVHRNCVIPDGRAIFFPVVNDLISFYEYPNLQNELRLHDYARSDLDETIEVTVFVDSNLIKDSKKFRIHTNIFEIALPSKEDSSDLVPTRAVSDGYWIFLKPLPLGHHTLHFIGEKLAYDEFQNQGGTKRFPKFRVEAIYDIEIVDSKEPNND